MSYDNNNATKSAYKNCEKPLPLLMRIADGDQAAVAECISKYGNLVWAFARKINSNFEDAEDLSQDIFLSIWQNAARYDESIASEATFISMIARRRLLDRIRIAYRRPQTDTIEEKHDVFAAPAASSDDKIDASRIFAVLKRLRPIQNEMIRLNLIDGMSHQEIADYKNLPIGTIKTHIRRGLTAARALLRQNAANHAQHTSVC